jgi:hypothetical protein
MEPKPGFQTAGRERSGMAGEAVNYQATFL